VDADSGPTIRAMTAGQKVFGRYSLEVLAGRGGMGVVWRARDEELGETVALKFLPEIVARDPVAIDELKEETRRARRLTHPNIVRIHDFVRDELQAAVSMEFVDGTTLGQLRLQQPDKVFSVETLGPLAAQLCAALDYAHNTGKVVHRDLKPANLLVTRDGGLKVTDFGIARSLTETHTRLTGRAAGDTSGTLLYMSPQQHRHARPHERTAPAGL
jgi:serine/threonine protein kinase